MVKFKEFFRKRKSLEKVKQKSILNGIPRDVDPMDSWDIVGELGDGAFGKVYKTKRKETDLKSALKKVDFESETELEDFMVEIEILTQFKHPNILSLLEVYIYDSQLWMFLELCTGGALDSLMNNLDRPLSEPEIKFVTREVVSGLQFLHESLIIHRDMKAGNILVTGNYEIRLADFGVSARLSTANQMRRTFIGTPYWMAPEVIACDSPEPCPYNWKADIWSLGITLIELAQMHPPHNEVSPARVFTRISRSDAPKLARPSRWSRHFSLFLDQCLQKDPGVRSECSELLKHPFIADVTEEDRKHVKLLICEAKADVVEVEEEVTSDVTPSDADEADSLPELLVLSDSTKIEIPIELNEDEDEDVGEPDVSTPLPSVDRGSVLNTNNKAFLDQLITELSDQLIENVITSEKHHPSIPSCVFEVMRELSEQAAPVPANTSSVQELKTPSGISRRHSAYRSMTRTRRFVVDGKEMVSTTRHVVRNNPAEQRLRAEQMNQHKAELRAFRVLGKQETRQIRELSNRSVQQREQIEAKMTAEFLVLKRAYEQKLEQASRSVWAQLERLDKEHDLDIKRIRTNADKEEETFKAQLRAELHKYTHAERKAAKRELQGDIRSSITSLSSLRSVSSSNLSINSSKGSVISARLKAFREEHTSRLKERLHQVTMNYFSRRENVKRAEAVEKQALRMNFEQEKWKMDQRHIRWRHQFARKQLQDFFLIKRQKLSGLLDLELNGLRQTIVQERATLNTAHAIERKNHAKHAKATYKRYHTNLHRLSHLGSASQLREQVSADADQIRLKLEEDTRQFEGRLHRQVELLEQSIVSRLKELEINHSIRRNELIDLEADRLQEIDDRFESDLRSYMEALPDNISLLKAQFEKELDAISLSAATEDDMQIHTNRSLAGLPLPRRRPPQPSSSRQSMLMGN